ncbi:MAG TPA: hypothetical protein VFX48_09925 [Saprospiraceae bacterium]|nr:hypothetical protein [Saprospiraceae bacterium]
MRQTNATPRDPSWIDHFSGTDDLAPSWLDNYRRHLSWIKSHDEHDDRDLLKDMIADM